MKVIRLIKVLVIFIGLVFNSYAENSKNDTLIIDVTKIIKNKIEDAKWLKNSIARADLFNIPVMVAIYEGNEVDIFKTDGEDPAIFSRVIANGLIDKALREDFNKFETFIVDTLFDENIDKQETDLYILRNYISHVSNKRKPIYIVSTEILRKEKYNQIGKEFQDSILSSLRIVSAENKIPAKVIKNKKKRKKSWFKRAKREEAKESKIDSLALLISGEEKKDTIVEVFQGTDSVVAYDKNSNKKVATVGFLLFLIGLISVAILFWVKEMRNRS